MVKLLKKHKYKLILTILILIYIIYFTTAGFLRYDNFYAGRYDLGNMDQTVWNTLNGSIFQTNSEEGLVISRLAYHADFILIFLSPFYLLWSNPKMLLAIQTIVLALGAIFVFLIAKEILKSKNFALLFGFLFLMNPEMQLVNLYDFHAVALATTFLLAAFYFLIKKRYLMLIIFLVLSGICKEQIWIITGLFGLLMLFQKTRKTRLLGSAIAIFSFIIFTYLVTNAMPQSLGGQHFALAYFSDFGNSPTAVVSNVILSPQKVFSTIFNESGINYLIKIFSPLGFISFLSPLHLLFIIPNLLINLLSSNHHLREIYYQYTSAITPFVFISAIYGVKRFTKWFPKIPIFLIGISLLFTTLWASYSVGPFPGAKHPNLDMFTKPYPNKHVIEAALSTIPAKYSVAATNNVGSHLSHRKILYTIPYGVYKADVLVFLLRDGSAKPTLNAQRDIVKKLKQDENYVLVFEKDDFTVFKKQEVLL